MTQSYRVFKMTASYIIKLCNWLFYYKIWRICMKKLLILSMVISAITYAESEGNKMEIEVKVIRPLTISNTGY